ncbi:MAG: SRPBCC family protein [Thermodesulfobacteriota bacterium]
MHVLNIHERELPFPADQVGKLIDTLSSPEDALWPKELWPPMRFDRPLSVGAVGGHGPVGYEVEDYVPGISVRFRFRAPKGYDGFHEFRVIAVSSERAVLRHTIEMTAHGIAVLSWLLAIRPLHDALLEDSLALAEASLGLKPRVIPWSCRVRLLRRLLSRGKTRPQQAPIPFPSGARVDKSVISD